MIYTNRDAPDLQPSRLCLGTMNFGPKADEKESHAVLDCSPDLGINFADTADIYRYRKALGTGAVWTEEIICDGGDHRAPHLLTTRGEPSSTGPDCSVTTRSAGHDAIWPGPGEAREDYAW